jgi:hypothetical protein
MDWLEIALRVGQFGMFLFGLGYFFRYYKRKVATYSPTAAAELTPQRITGGRYPTWSRKARVRSITSVVDASSYSSHERSVNRWLEPG